MALQVLLFDLDDTLLIDDPATYAVFDAVAERAAAEAQLDAVWLSTAAKRWGEELWSASEGADYCNRIGISPYECLWARFDEPIPELQKLSEWSRIFRVQVWEKALKELGLADRDLAARLAQSYFEERRQRMELMPGALAVIGELRRDHRLGILTNGAPGLQREKIAAAGLEREFEEILVSGEIGIGKPDKAVFETILRRMRARPDEAVMIGNSLDRDIAGARNAGLRSVWIHVPGCGDTGDARPDFTIRDLHELPGLLRGAT